MNWLHRLFQPGTPEPTSVSNYLPSVEDEANVIYRGLIKEMTGPIGPRVRSLLTQSCKQTTLTADVPTKVVEEIHAASLAGCTAKSIASSLVVSLPDLKQDHLVSIVRTISGKAAVALNRARCEELGIDWYVWRTSQDIRVRKSHRKMQDVIVAWKDPQHQKRWRANKQKETIMLARQLIVAASVPLFLTLSDVKWPHCVYHRGKIARVSKGEFKRISGMKA